MSNRFFTNCIYVTIFFFKFNTIALVRHGIIVVLDALFKSDLITIREKNIFVDVNCEKYSIVRSVGL